MKRIKFLAAIILALFLFNNCEDDLDVTPQSLITAQSMWNNEEDAKSGIIGLLNRFRSTFNSDNTRYWFELRSGVWDWGLIGEDAGTPGWQTLMDNDLDASSSPGTNWANLYTTINSANLAIKYIPQIEFRSEDTKNYLLAQAYFVRAYTYFALARIYGDVPVLLNGFESADAEDMFPERQPVNEVFQQIKSDVNTGLEIWSENVSFSRIKPTKAALNMLKADVYLWTAKRLNGGNSDLSAAFDAVDNVLSNSNYELLSSYEQVFREEDNKEIIFALYLDILENTGYYMPVYYTNADVPDEYENNPVIIGGTNRLRFSDMYITNYLDKIPNDKRKNINYVEFTADGKTYKYCNKYIGEWTDGRRILNTDIRLYRYAEAILFKAEILNAQGSTSEAVGYLNQITKRATGIDNYYSTSLSKEEVDDAILDERLVEFGGEAKAWFDIIRFGKAFERIPSLIGRESDKQGNVLLFPVSPATITQNKNIDQTSGY
ncbi:MAG: RagB/SusD family nutrient uptake outer membrane protein [Draconibacterium sp.]